MTQPALFDIPVAPTAGHAASCCPGGCLTHSLLPNMAYACYETILTVGGHFEMGTSNFDKVTCPACRAVGPEQIRIRMRRQMGRCVACGGDLKRDTCTDCGVTT